MKKWNTINHYRDIFIHSTSFTVRDKIFWCFEHCCCLSSNGSINVVGQLLNRMANHGPHRETNDLYSMAREKGTVHEAWSPCNCISMNESVVDWMVSLCIFALWIYQFIEHSRTIRFLFNMLHNVSLIKRKCSGFELSANRIEWRNAEYILAAKKTCQQQIN